MVTRYKKCARCASRARIDFFALVPFYQGTPCTGRNFRFTRAGDVQRALGGFHGEGRDVTKFVRELAVEYPPAATGLMARCYQPTTVAAGAVA